MKNKIKKTLAVMAIMAMALSSVGCACGKPSAEDSKVESSKVTEKEESSKTSKDESSKVDAKEESSKVNSKEESSKTENSKTTSKDESSKTTSKEESSKTENSKTTSTESSKTQSGSGNNSTTNKPSGGSGSTTGNTGSGNTTTQGCTHNWVQQYKTVHHDAVTHTEQVQTGTTTVVDQEGYEYEEIVGEQWYILFSNGEEWEYDINTVTEEFEERVANHSGDIGGSYAPRSRYIYETRYVAPVTHEEPVYETRTVTDKAAYDEQVADGYKCSKCGATK